MLEFPLNYIREVLTFVYAHFSSEKLVIQIIWGCIPLFIFLISLELYNIFKHRFFLNRKQRRQLKIQNRCKESIITYIMAGDADSEQAEKEESLQKLKKISGHRYDRNTILEEIIKLHQSLSGDYGKGLENLYSEMGLQKYSVKKLKSIEWHLKIKGLKELSEMNCASEYIDYLKKQLRHKNPLVKQEVQLVIVQLEGASGLVFLKDYEGLISDWQQFQIIEMLCKLKNVNFIEMPHWLASENHTVVKLGLKICEVFSLIQHQQLIIDVLNREEVAVRKEATLLIKKFGMLNAIPQLKDLYEKEISYQEKKLVFDVLCYFESFANTENYLELEDLTINEPHNYLRKAI